MTEKLEPALDRFVIRAAEPSAELPQSVRALGDLQKLPAREPLHELTLKSGPRGESAWLAIAQQLQGGNVYPVLIDHRGETHYPTGEVTVRFEHTPSADSLRHFGESQGLLLERANPYAPQQFVFVPIHPTQEYLPRLVDRLARLPGVRRAWANTLTRFRRGT